MSENQRPRAGAQADDEYREFVRKMELFENGPTTTHFAQLIAHGIQLPEPDSISDADISAKLWEVIAGLSRLRVYLDQTDHLNDRELYAMLWHDVLRTDVPAVDEIGFDNHVGLLSSGSEEQTAVYLKYYADEDERRDWARNFGDSDLPLHEDPPHNRDPLLPRPRHEHGPEALEWLRANPNPSPLAANRFSTLDEAVTFVEALYAAGATDVAIGNILMLPNDRWAPYADTLLVDLPADHAQRGEVFELVETIGRPDDEDEPLIDEGQSTIRLWWDQRLYLVATTSHHALQRRSRAMVTAPGGSTAETDPVRQEPRRRGRRSAFRGSGRIFLGGQHGGPRGWRAHRRRRTTQPYSFAAHSRT